MKIDPKIFNAIKILHQLFSYLFLIYNASFNEIGFAYALINTMHMRYYTSIIG